MADVEFVCWPEKPPIADRWKISLDKCRPFGYGKVGSGCGQHVQIERSENHEGVRGRQPP